MADTLHVDDRVTFAEEKRAYTVQAVSDDGRWAVCTKPFPPQQTVIYTVVDLVDEVRGTDNYWGLGYETREQCENACGMFERGEAEFSHRRPPIDCKITRVRPAAKTEVSRG